MQKLIVANWKMNPETKEEAERIFEGIKKGASNSASEVLVCPPFVYLPLLKGLELCGQNVFFEEKGAFTGEISPLMLKNLGVKYVMVGHSEIRKYFGDTDEIINKKIKKSLEDGFKIIFCIGETKEEKEAGKRNEVLKLQIEKGLAEVTDFSHINIAYEPVWSIGTGNSCSEEETKDAIDFIRTLVHSEVRVIYGGSVTSKNAEGYIKHTGTDGLLVGSASLNPEEFTKIIESAE